MIQCPECGKEIADDSVHCGYCGATIEAGTGKKTMIGFAALTGDALEQAAEEAKAARKAAEANREKGVGEELSESKLKIPRPSAPKPSSSRPDRPKKPGGLSIPSPESISEASEAKASDAKTETLTSVDSSDSRSPAPPTAQESPVGHPPGEGDEVRADFAGSDVADTDPGGFDPDSVDVANAPTEPPGAERVAEPFGDGTSESATPGAEKTLPEAGPSHAGGGPTALEGPPGATGPTEFGDAPLEVASNTLPEKKQNPLVIVGLIFAALIAFCCIASLLFTFLL